MPHCKKMMQGILQDFSQKNKKNIMEKYRNFYMNI